MNFDTAAELKRVLLERDRQEHLRATGHFQHGPADSALSLPAILAVLAEEVGEVARHVCDDMHGKGLDKAALREELIQVAAVAVGWAERCTRELAEPRERWGIFLHDCNGAELRSGLRDYGVFASQDEAQTVINSACYFGYYARQLRGDEE